MKHITIPINCQKIRNTQVLVNLNNLNSLTVVSSTEAKACEGLTNRVLENLHQYDRITNNYECAIIGCKDGTVIIVRFLYGSWGYEVCGPNHKYATSSSSTNKSFEDELDYVRAYAGRAFGGIVWETLR